MAYLSKGDEIPTKGKGSKLSGKMQRFVDEYMVDMNASQAVLRAGYKTKNQGKMAEYLKCHPLVAREIKNRLSEKREQNMVDANYVIAKLTSIVEDTETGNPQAALRGLELLGKHLGLFKERTEISGPDGGAIEMEQKEIQKNVSEFSSRMAKLAKRNGTDGVSEFPKPERDSGA